MLSFANVPNVGNNPLPKHVFELKAPLAVVHAMLVEVEMLKVCTTNAMCVCLPWASVMNSELVFDT